jgi:IS5 family transposase
LSGQWDPLYRFVGLSLSATVSDHNSIWRFRNLLTKHDLMDILLTEINDQLQKQGLLIKTGEISIIDATVIEAHQSRPRKNAKGENPKTKKPDTTLK